MKSTINLRSVILARSLFCISAVLVAWEEMVVGVLPGAALAIQGLWLSAFRMLLRRAIRPSM